MAMSQQNKTKVFLLGGADLEMVTIRQMLQEFSCEVIDKGLKWGDAVLGVYTEELNRYASDTYEIYGVELQEDGTAHPFNYIKLDHHGELKECPAALEQVAHLLSHELTFQEKLIAANDRGYYSAMKKVLDEEKPELSELEKQRMMDEIRKMDRAAQGVSDEEEIIAESICREERYEKTSFCTFVEVPQKMSFSPITDRLWPYERLVVYSLSKSGMKLCYYGKDAERVLDSVKKRFEDDIEKDLDPFYSGGGADGYWGVKENSLPEKLVSGIVDYIKDFNDDHSHHLFYFPFVWSGSVNLEDLEKAGKWERVKVAGNSVEKYDERNYFYKFVNEKLYDAGRQSGNGSKVSQVCHYRRVIDGNARYIIEANSSIYDLKINSIEVKLYTTGVGLIAYSLENDRNLFPSPDDVLNINQFGRRVFPPFYNDVLNEDNRIEIAKSITIAGVERTDIKEDFNGYKENPECWTAGKIVSVLLNDLLKDGVYEPVIDDRMFVISWYKNTSLVKNAVKDYSNDRDFWYRYLYVDRGSPMCQDEGMRDSLIREHTYRRFANWGTLYGITRYSMVMLANDDAPGHLLNTFTSIYARMVELVLMQRASVLKFSKEVNDINNSQPIEDIDVVELGKRTASLSQKYINFKNQFYFKEVTAQEQGIELYDMLQQSLRLDIMVKDLDDDIQELYQFSSILEERASNKAAADLNAILGAFTPAAFLLSVLAFEHWVFKNVYLDKTILTFSALLLAVPLLMFIKWIYKKIQ